jgi:hypothetical protein
MTAATTVTADSDKKEAETVKPLIFGKPDTSAGNLFGPSKEEDKKGGEAKPNIFGALSASAAPPKLGETKPDFTAASISKPPTQDAADEKKEDKKSDLFGGKQGLSSAPFGTGLSTTPPSKPEDGKQAKSTTQAASDKTEYIQTSSAAPTTTATVPPSS